MDISGLLSDSLGRVRDDIPRVVGGLDVDQLAWRPDEASNPIGWLVWHLTRIEDDHIAEVAGTEQVWTSEHWYERFALPFPPEAHGFGQSAADVAKVRVDADLLAGYHDATAARAIELESSSGRQESWSTSRPDTTSRTPSRTRPSESDRSPAMSM